MTATLTPNASRLESLNRAITAREDEERAIHSEALSALLAASLAK